MRVEGKMTLQDYARDDRFRGRVDNLAAYSDSADRFVLISQHYYYFARAAIDISSIPTTYLDHPFEKRGPHYGSDFSDAFIADFENWLEANYFYWHERFSPVVLTRIVSLGALSGLSDFYKLMVPPARLDYMPTGT